MIRELLWKGQDDERDVNYVRAMLGLMMLFFGVFGIANAGQIQGRIWLVAVFTVISVVGVLAGLVVSYDEFMNSGPDA